MSALIFLFLFIEIYSEKAANYTVYLEMNKNLFTMPVYLGSAPQKLNLILKTDKTILMVGGKECYGCKSGTSFDKTQSTSYAAKAKDRISFLNSVFIGEKGSDVISIMDLKINSEFFIIQNIEEIQFLTVDGFMGLGPSKQKEDNIIYNLKKKRSLEKAVYGMLLNPEYPYLHLGFYDENMFNWGKQITTKINYPDIDLITSWYFMPKKIKFNKNEITTSEKFILNTASNGLVIPKSFYDKNKQNIFSKASRCNYADDNLFHCKCDTFDLFPNITIEFESDKFIYFEPSNYIQQLTSESDLSKECILSISLNYRNDFWIIGSNMVKNYYTIFDLENESVTFIDIRGYAFGSISNTFIIGGIILICSVAFFMAIYFIYRKAMSRTTAQAYQEIP
jgi:hypothetical protein